MAQYVNYIEWRTHPFRSDRWLEIWRPALERALSYGADGCFLSRNIDDPLHFRQVTTWDDKDDFERYWASDEIAAMRQASFNYFNKPLAYVWHTLVVDTTPAEAAEAAAVEAGD
jgi:heme-degrading monooxygenase HmoA